MYLHPRIAQQQPAWPSFLASKSALFSKDIFWTRGWRENLFFIQKLWETYWPEQFINQKNVSNSDEVARKAQRSGKENIYMPTSLQSVESQGCNPWNPKPFPSIFFSKPHHIIGEQNRRYFQSFRRRETLRSFLLSCQQNVFPLCGSALFLPWLLSF